MIYLATWAVVATLLFVAAFGVLMAAGKELGWVRAHLEAEVARTSDLHSRLASRTYSEYAAFNGQRPEPVEEERYIWDETGLMAVRDDGEDR